MRLSGRFGSPGVVVSIAADVAGKAPLAQQPTLTRVTMSEESATGIVFGQPVTITIENTE